MKKFVMAAIGLLFAATAFVGPANALVTVPTAAGISITVSEGFAPTAQAIIADAVAHGTKFRRITCYSHARTHVSNSNHHGGNACDSHPHISAQIVRAHGARSGCDFRDCEHFDNARNVGGVAYWNSVKHGGSRTFAARSHHHHHHRMVAYAEAAPADWMNAH